MIAAAWGKIKEPLKKFTDAHMQQKWGILASIHIEYQWKPIIGPILSSILGNAQSLRVQMTPRLLSG